MEPLLSESSYSSEWRRTLNIETSQYIINREWEELRRNIKEIKEAQRDGGCTLPDQLFRKHSLEVRKWWHQNRAGTEWGSDPHDSRQKTCPSPGRSKDKCPEAETCLTCSRTARAQWMGGGWEWGEGQRPIQKNGGKPHRSGLRDHVGNVVRLSSWVRQEPLSVLLRGDVRSSGQISQRSPLWVLFGGLTTRVTVGSQRKWQKHIEEDANWTTTREGLKASRNCVLTPCSFSLFQEITGSPALLYCQKCLCQYSVYI